MRDKVGESHFKSKWKDRCPIIKMADRLEEEGGTKTNSSKAAPTQGAHPVSQRQAALQVQRAGLG